MGTSTEILRKLLDERGIKHDEEGAYLTFWGDCDAIAAEQKGSKYLWLAHYATPEQAIAATLGRGTMNSRAERTCKLLVDGDLLHCSNCGGAAEKQSWAYWSHCPNCGKKVVDE